MSPEAVQLIVDDLRLEDLPAIAWSGSAVHLRSVEANLRRGRHAIDYLCVRTPEGAPVAKGGVDYEEHPGAGTLTQLSVHPDLQGRGLGTMLIAGAEDRIRSRGLPIARIGVEDGNEGARRLYERLGYTWCGRWSASWPALGADGVEYLHEATGDDFEKRLSSTDPLNP